TELCVERDRAQAPLAEASADCNRCVFIIFSEVSERPAVACSDRLDRRGGCSKCVICFFERFQCNAKLLLCLVVASAETRERVLGDLVKLGAQLRMLTPKLLIDVERRNEKNTRIVIVVSERMQMKPLQGKRHNELQSGTLPER